MNSYRKKITGSQVWGPGMPSAEGKVSVSAPTDPSQRKKNSNTQGPTRWSSILLENYWFEIRQLREQPKSQHSQVGIRSYGCFGEKERSIHSYSRDCIKHVNCGYLLTNLNFFFYYYQVISNKILGVTPPWPSAPLKLHLCQKVLFN